MNKVRYDRLSSVDHFVGSTHPNEPALGPAVIALLLTCLFLLCLFALLARFLLCQLVRLVVETESVPCDLIPTKCVSIREGVSVRFRGYSTAPQWRRTTSYVDVF